MNEKQLTPNLVNNSEKMLTKSWSAKDTHYKWSKIFAAKRYGKKDLKLYRLEQDELLNDILDIKSQEDEDVIPKCNQCGGKKVSIRGKYPKDHNREICPTCTYDRLEQINELSNPDYCKTYLNN